MADRETDCFRAIYIYKCILLGYMCSFKQPSIVKDARQPNPDGPLEKRLFKEVWSGMHRWHNEVRDGDSERKRAIEHDSKKEEIGIKHMLLFLSHSKQMELWDATPLSAGWDYFLSYAVHTYDITDTPIIRFHSKNTHMHLYTQALLDKCLCNSLCDPHKVTRVLFWEVSEMCRSVCEVCFVSFFLCWRFSRCWRGGSWWVFCHLLMRVRFHSSFSRFILHSFSVLIKVHNYSLFMESNGLVKFAVLLHF